MGLWRDVPDVLVARTGCPAFVYSRAGHGASDPPPSKPTVRFMHDEALTALPALLDEHHITNPILIGHSDGASIAIIFAATHPARRLVLLAPHVFVEACTIASIERMRELYRTTSLRERLAKHHRDVDEAFYGWNDVWLDPGFRGWNIEAYLPRITCPMLVIQGEDDEYGSARQVEAVAAHAGGRVETLMLPRCGHAPHRDQRELALDRIAGFIEAERPEGLSASELPLNHDRR